MMIEIGGFMSPELRESVFVELDQMAEQAKARAEVVLMFMAERETTLKQLFVDEESDEALSNSEIYNKVIETLDTVEHECLRTFGIHVTQATPEEIAADRTPAVVLGLMRYHAHTSAEELTPDQPRGYSYYPTEAGRELIDTLRLAQGKPMAHEHRAQRQAIWEKALLETPQ